MIESAAEIGVDLTGLPPEQALALGKLTHELIVAAEARGEQRGRRWAITALRDRAATSKGLWLNTFESSEVAEALANYLEAIAEEGK